MESFEQLGFPVPLLGMEPVRLPILFDDGDLLVLAKPPGVLVQPDPWYPRLPVLIDAIRYQAAQDKPELARRGIGREGLWAITDLDPELFGPVLFARNRERAEELRNLMGSRGFLHTYVLLTRGTVKEPSIECDLPLARHSHAPRMLVSHTTGKKAYTTFHQDAPLGSYHFWRATTAFPRRHQVLLHAMESGLPVVGDTLYAHDPLVMLSNLKRGYSAKRDREERPLFDGPACYMSELDFGQGTVVQCPAPPRWAGLVKQLHKHITT